MSKSNYLLDSSLFIALNTGNHVFQRTADDWMQEHCECFFTCAITQGALVRLYLQSVTHSSMATAIEHLHSVTSHPKHRFLACDLSYTDLDPAGVFGHRQVTDAYLVQLGRKHGLKLATLDRAQTFLYPQDCVLVQ